MNLPCLKEPPRVIRDDVIKVRLTDAHRPHAWKNVLEDVSEPPVGQPTLELFLREAPRQATEKAVNRVMGHEHAVAVTRVDQPLHVLHTHFVGHDHFEPEPVKAHVGATFGNAQVIVMVIAPVRMPDQELARRHALAGDDIDLIVPARRVLGMRDERQPGDARRSRRRGERLAFEIRDLTIARCDLDHACANTRPGDAVLDFLDVDLDDVLYPKSREWLDALLGTTAL